MADVRRTAQLQPVAAPVDGFINAPRSPLRDVAEALGGFNKNLQDFMAVDAEKRQKDAETRGRVYGLTHTQEDVAKAEAQGVRTGRIPGQMSKNFMAAAHGAQGELAGGQLQSKWDQAFQQWEGKNSDDPAAYDQFVADFLKANLDEGANADFLRGAMPSVNVVINNGRAQYISYRNNAVQKQSLDAHTGAAANFIRRSDQVGLTTEGGTDYEANYTMINRKREEFIGSGGNPEEFDKAMMLTMSALAIETQDPHLVDWFSKEGPTGLRPDATPAGMQIKNQTMNTLRSIASEQLTTEAKRVEDLRKKELNAAHVGIIQSLIQSPTEPVPEDVLKAAEKNGDWDIRTKISKMRKDLNTEESNPEQLKAVTSAIINNTNVDPMRIVQQALEEGVFKSNDDLTKAASFAQSFKDNQDKMNAVSNRGSYQQALKAIEGRTTALNDMGNPINGLSNSALAATYDFRQLMARWMIDNPNATDQDIEKRIMEVQTTILGNIRNDAGQVLDPNTKQTPGTYQRDEGLNSAFPNQASVMADTGDLVRQAEEQQAMDEQDARKSKGKEALKTPSTAGPTDDQVKKYLDGMDPEKRSLLEKNLKERGTGMTLEQFGRNVLRKNMKATPISFNPNDTDNGAGDTRPRTFTQQQAQGWIESSVAAEKSTGNTSGSMADNLLSLIGRSEGDGSGNYNAVFGDPGGSVDLSKFSVDDVIARQQWARQNGYKSTAIGKYQVIYDTLQSLKAEGVVRGDEAFTPELQDRMGHALLNRRGLQDFQNGKISSRQFALRLSQEWAALPNPDTGRSYYDADGLNKSRTSRSSVYSAMGLGAQPISYGNEADISGLRFNHPEQAAGMKREVKSIIAGAYQDLGISNPTIISGHRDPTHRVERGKKSGGGEHTHGNAGDVSLEGLNDQQRANLVQSLIARGAKRFITYSKYPDMLHVDTKDQNGDGSPYFMHNTSAKNIAGAPEWFRQIALGPNT